MDTEQIRACIKQSITSVSNIESTLITDDASYRRDLALDSLAVLEIVVDAESQFGIKISEEELSRMQTVRETIELIQQRLCVTAA